MVKDKENIFVQDSEKEGSKYIATKFDFDLFDNEKNVPEDVFRAKHVADKIKMYKNSKLLFIIEHDDLTKKELEFLHTVQGMVFLVNQCKATSSKTLNQLKNEIKQILKCA